MIRNFNPALPFLDSARAHAGRVALVAGKREVSYAELAGQVSRLAGSLARVRRSGRVGILATRSAEAYIGILAACMAGGTYVPLNQKWPADRLVKLMTLLDLDALIVDRNGAALLTPDVLGAAPALIVGPREANMPEGAAARVAAFDALEDLPLTEAVPVGPEHHAYVMFTSGTTGLPKGVVISTESLAAYLTESRPWTALTPDDRVAEAQDITFDLSVHNLFLTLEAGASLHLMSALELMAPAHFIRSHAITAWMSVPTVANMMRKSGALRPGLFETVRLSLFCGEPLPAATADAWAAATPNGVVDNIYGPTECTVAVLRQPWSSAPLVTAERGVVAIGKPFDSVKAMIVSPHLEPMPDGMPGEIALGGPQVGVGYFAAPGQTQDRFRTIGGERWYLTGDLGRKDADGVFHHLGRIDNQVKIKGNRIELEEVEAHLRTASGCEAVAVVAWPVVDGAPQGLVGFVACAGMAPQAIQEAMWRTLPRYMTPDAIHIRETLPVNTSGKVDRRALRDSLEEGPRERRTA